MTSTTTGLPDRYRPLDQVAPDEPTPTGVIRSWRAKDRVLNRDVAIRVHTPGGPAAHAWIARALTAGGLATPALAMVYDAAEGTGDADAPGSAAYVVNEWIDGETLAARLERGALPQREARTIIRRLAEGVAEAHRVGLAVGGLTPEHVVLRPNGLVGLRAVPAASGTVQGDITALGALLEACLGGPQAIEAAGRSGRRPSTVPPDLAALVRRARSTEPGQGLSSVAAMVSLLNERPRAGGPATGPTTGPVAGERTGSDNGWLARLRERRPGDAPDDATGDATGDAPDEGGRHTAPPERTRPAAVDLEPPAPTIGVDVPVRMGAHALPPVPRSSQAGYDERWADDLGVLDDYDEAEHGGADPEEPRARRRLLVIGLPVLALAVVVALAWWFGTNVLSVASSVDAVGGSTPSATSSPAAGSSSGAPAPAPAPGAPAAIVGAHVFDPFGDGAPENDDQVARSYDNDPATAWSTLKYRGSAAFGNLKPGVGVLYDLGSEQKLAGTTITTTTPGVTVEVRTGNAPDGALESFPVAASGRVDGTTDLAFPQPATARFVLVWVTGLVPADGGFAGDVAEVAVHTAG